MLILHFGEGQAAYGQPNDNITGVRWVVRNKKKVLQCRKFGIPADYEFREGQISVPFFWYWEDVLDVEIPSKENSDTFVHPTGSNCVGDHWTVFGPKSDIGTVKPTEDTTNFVGSDSSGCLNPSKYTGDQDGYNNAIPADKHAFYFTDEADSQTPTQEGLVPKKRLLFVFLDHIIRKIIYK